jgi:NAD(P)-dependent dehydrogenase (short-subunit alcohol dehydrogenase family)
MAAAGLGAALATRALLRHLRAYDFDRKVVLITGGSRGLGLCMARELAAQGASLALCARNTDELNRAEAELTATGADVFTVSCDVTVQQEAISLVEAVMQQYGRLDVLVNNAGIIEVGPLETMKIEDFEEEMKTHFWAPLYATFAALPELRKRKGSRIVNIASVGGKLSVPHLLPYSASKFALVGLSEGLRAELAKDGITVTTVCPGLMRTGSHLHAKFKGQHKKEYTAFTLFTALPGNSISAQRAAKRIVSACKYGEAELVLGLPAQLGSAIHGLFPGLTTDMFGLVNRLLPVPGGIGTDVAEGQDSQTNYSPSWFTKPLEAAAKRNNEAA